MRLPTWKEANENVGLHVATPLEKFVDEHEPLEISKAAHWRRDLIQMLDYYKYQNESVEYTETEDNTLPLPLDVEPE